MLAVPCSLQHEPLLGYGGTRAGIGISANHASITIDGNAQLAAFPGKTGSGTAGVPYVIKDFIIDAGGNRSAISISNTDAYLIISNCTVFNSSIAIEEELAGIRLESCRNVNISGNNASYNFRCGIYLCDSNDSIVSGNTASFNTAYGIWLEDGSNNTISDNNASQNRIAGILLLSSSNSTISGNNASHNTWNGISSALGSNNTISGNNLRKGVDAQPDQRNKTVMVLNRAI